jgi:hypothetical protein
MARHFVLNTGATVPSVGLGTWQAKPGVVGDAIYAAVKVRVLLVCALFCLMVLASTLAPAAGCRRVLLPVRCGCVHAVVQAGYRHIDCAQAYFNEKEIGFALKRVFDEGIAKREDLFITSKLWSVLIACTLIVRPQLLGIICDCSNLGLSPIEIAQYTPWNIYLAGARTTLQRTSRSHWRAR